MRRWSVTTPSASSVICSTIRGLGRKLLGLVTVARGGLSRDDLVELSGESPWTVDRTLRSVLGRTFHGRRTAGGVGAACVRARSRRIAAGRRQEPEPG